MELPAEVLIHNEVLGLKGSRGDLLRISPEGYYEVNLAFGERIHRVLLPIESTVVIQREAEELQQANQQLAREAHTDGLTQIAAEENHGLPAAWPVEPQGA